MSLPLTNVAPARTSATRCGPLTARQRSWAASMSLNAMASPAVREPGPRVSFVRCRTVANVLSMGFVTGMKDHGAAGPVDLIAAGGAGCGRFTVRPSGTGLPGVKQGGQAGLVQWAESPC